MKKDDYRLYTKDDISLDEYKEYIRRGVHYADPTDDYLNQYLDDIEEFYSDGWTVGTAMTAILMGY